MINEISKALIYEELGLNPLWKEREEQNNPTNTMAFFQEFEHTQTRNSFLILAITEDSEIIGKKNLFQSITKYISSIAQKKNDTFKISRNINTSSIDLGTNPNYILLAIDELSYSLNSFIETYHSSTIIKSKVSLDEMIKNPKKKAILWEDMQVLFHNLEKK